MEEAVALEDVRECFPELRAQRAVLLGGGAVRSFLVDDAIVFRFPLHAAAAAALDSERRLLLALAPLLPVAIPDQRFRAQPSRVGALPFVGHPVLDGPSARSRNLDAKQAADLGRDLGHALRVLASVPVTVAWTCGVGLRPSPHHNLAARYRALAIGYQRIRQTLPPTLSSRCDKLLPRMVIPPPFVDATTLVQGSISQQTIHVGKSVGIAAWEAVDLGDPAVDLGGVRFAFGAEALEAAVRDSSQRKGLVERAVFIARCRGLSIVVDPVTPIVAKAWALDRIE